jgi:hypothetical protein
MTVVKLLAACNEAGLTVALNVEADTIRVKGPRAENPELLAALREQKRAVVRHLQPDPDRQKIDKQRTAHWRTVGLAAPFDDDGRVLSYSPEGRQAASGADRSRFRGASSNRWGPCRAGSCDRRAVYATERCPSHTEEGDER